MFCSYDGPVILFEDGWRNPVFAGNGGLGVGSISVPFEYLADYIALASDFGVPADRFSGR